MHGVPAFALAESGISPARGSHTRRQSARKGSCLAAALWSRGGRRGTTDAKAQAVDAQAVLQTTRSLLTWSFSRSCLAWTGCLSNVTQRRSHHCSEQLVQWLKRRSEQAVSSSGPALCEHAREYLRVSATQLLHFSCQVVQGSEGVNWCGYAGGATDMEFSEDASEWVVDCRCTAHRRRPVELNSGKHQVGKAPSAHPPM